MDPLNPNPLSGIELNNPPPETLLSSKYLNPDYLFQQGYDFFSSIIRYLFSPDGRETITTIMFWLALFFVTIIMYVIVRMVEIRRKEHHHHHHAIHEYAMKQAEKERRESEKRQSLKNPRWAVVLEYLFSPNENEWRLAIIEADAMLETLLDQLGFKGETIGEKLKTADSDTFKMLPAAWEVHTIRNRIAHEGSEFHISTQEAKRIIALYEQIFRSYGFI